MKKINVYDFDKTLYKKDASLEFWKYCVKKNKLLILLLPYQVIFLIMNKLKIVSTKLFKQEFFIFLKFMQRKNIDNFLIEFWDKELENMNLEVVSTLKLNKLKNICISASPKFILEIPCKKLNIDLLIGTDFELNTFKIIGENCKGNQKIIDLNKHIKNYDIQNFYSDSYSDLPLFNIA
ncbi:MAG: haloacid dehalogenase-like hydrolase, partial [Cetobacterium sp.]